LKVEKSGGVAVGEGECGETGVELLSRERRSLEILSVKKEAVRLAFPSDSWASCFVTTW